MGELISRFRRLTTRGEGKRARDAYVSQLDRLSLHRFRWTAGSIKFPDAGSISERRTYIAEYYTGRRVHPIRLQHRKQIRFAHHLPAHQMAHTERILQEHLVDPLQRLRFGP